MDTVYVVRRTSSFHRVYKPQAVSDYEAPERPNSPLAIKEE